MAHTLVNLPLDEESPPSTVENLSSDFCDSLSRPSAGSVAIGESSRFPELLRARNSRAGSACRAPQNLASIVVRSRRSAARSDRATRFHGAVVVASPRIQESHCQRNTSGRSRVISATSVRSDAPFASVCVCIHLCSPRLLRHPAPWNCIRIG